MVEPLSFRQRVRKILRREVIGICLVVFMADTANGIISPTFSLYAKSLGASLALIGTLSAIVGLTRIISAVPIGGLSDARGRKNVLSAGMLLFSASSFLYALAPDPFWLFPARILAGLAAVSIFYIGVAYVGDIVAKSERGLAIGLYTTSMGTGFALGPAIGGTVAANWSYQASYQIAAVVALIGFIATRFLLTEPKREHDSASPTSTSFATKLKLLARDPNLLAASLANMLMSEVFGGVIVNFFPLYAATLSIGDAMIGYMFSLRTFTSAAARLPTGLLTVKFSTRTLMLTSLSLAMLMAFAISFTTTPLFLMICLAGEGLSFGMFLTSGQAFVTEHSSASDRGTAMAVYSTAGSIGATVGPLILGFIAEAWGLTAVFRFTAILVFIGVCALWYISFRKQTVPVSDSAKAVQRLKSE
jgi:MFS family permease